MAKDKADPAIAKARALVAAKKITLQDLGLAMGYPEESARKSAWQLLHMTADPKVSMLRRFAKAMGIEAKDLLS